MDTPNTIPNIKNLSSQLLDNHSNGILVKQIIDEIHAIFTNATKITGYDYEFGHGVSVKTAMGMALSLNHAAQCLVDYKRTIQFLKGITAAIKDKQEAFPGETINIFYAGCGPYAPFVTLVAPLYKPSEVRFTVLEINQESLLTAEKLIATLGLTEYVDNFYVADAVISEIPEANKYHILFSETLDAQLYRESFVPILWNMIPQFNDDVIILPENVILKSSFGIFNGAVLTESESQTIFDTRRALKDHGVEELPNQLPTKTIEIPIEFDKATIIVDTEVIVYRDIKLVRDESVLTTPTGLDQDEGTNFTKVNFTYQIRPQLMLMIVAE